LCGTSSLVGSTVTGSDGKYTFEPSATMQVGALFYVCAVVPSGYSAGSNPGNPGYACSTNCFTFTEPGDFSHNIGLCPLSGSCSNVPPPCPDCVDQVISSAIGLGPAVGCTVLQLGASKVDITGPPGGIAGDVCIAPGGKLSITGTEFITGAVKLGAGATFANSTPLPPGGGVISNVDHSAEIAAAYAAATNAASLPCTQAFNTLDGKTINTITGVSGINVICVKDIVLSGKQIILTGPADAKFIFNIAGKFVFTGGGLGPQIRVDTTTGLKPSAVLYNVVGIGQDVAFSGGGGGVNCCAAIVDGTVLAPYRKIALSPGLVNGQIISGKDISIVSGSSVRCPPCNNPNNPN
jgi:choice-of-anchor A domain-containing protein